MINLKLRLQNKVTLMAILGAIFLLAQQLGIKLPSNIVDIANTAVTLLVLLGVVTDPTTKGLSDSEQALNYHEPKKQEDKNESNHTISINTSNCNTVCDVICDCFFCLSILFDF